MLLRHFSKRSFMSETVYERDCFMRLAYKRLKDVDQKRLEIMVTIESYRERRIKKTVTAYTLKLAQ